MSLEQLNHPVVVVAILGVAFSGVGSLVREVNFAIQKMKGKSVLDVNAGVMKEIVTELKLQGMVLQKILDKQSETHNIVHDMAFKRRV